MPRRKKSTGLFKRCDCDDGRKERCSHPWWGTYLGIKVSLPKWIDRPIDRPITTKTDAQTALDELRVEIRRLRDTGLSKAAVQKTLNKSKWVDPAAAPAQPDVLTFSKFADTFLTDYVQVNNPKDLKTRTYRLAIMKQAPFADRPLADIKPGDINRYLISLKTATKFHPHRKTEQVRQGPTINRYRALLRRMFSWAVEEDYLDDTPFRKRIRREPENDPRDRRLSDDEWSRLKAAMNPTVYKLAMVAAQTGMRRGEMLKLTWADLAVRPGWIQLRGRNTKTGKARPIPIHPDVQKVFDFLRQDVRGKDKPLDSRVFTNQVGEPIKDFRHAWRKALKLAGITDMTWRDLRHDFASRYHEQYPDLIQIRDLLGHSDVKMTQRYLNLMPDGLKAQVAKLKSLADPAPSTPTGGHSPDGGQEPPQNSHSIPTDQADPANPTDAVSVPAQNLRIF